MQLRQDGLNALDHANGVGARLPLYVQNDRRRLVHPGLLVVVLHSIHDLRDVLQHHRRTVAISNHDVAVVAATLELVVGVDLVVLPGTVEITLGRIHAGLDECRAKLLQSDAVRGQRGGICLYTDCRFLAPADAYQAHSVELREFRRKAGVHQVLHARKRHGIGGDGQGEHRHVRGIRLAIDGRSRQHAGQKALRRIDGRLHLFLGYVDVEAEAELQNDDRNCPRAGGRHLAEPLHLAELPLEWRGNRGGYNVWRRARIEREHLDGWIVHLRQRGNRQLRVGDHTHQQNRGHQQRRGNRPQDEWARRTHGVALFPLFVGLVAGGWVAAGWVPPCAPG